MSVFIERFYKKKKEKNIRNTERETRKLTILIIIATCDERVYLYYYIVSRYSGRRYRSFGNVLVFHEFDRCIFLDQ